MTVQFNYSDFDGVGNEIEFGLLDGDGFPLLMFNSPRLFHAGFDNIIATNAKMIIDAAYKQMKTNDYITKNMVSAEEDHGKDVIEHNRDENGALLKLIKALEASDSSSLFDDVYISVSTVEELRDAYKIVRDHKFSVCQIDVSELSDEDLLQTLPLCSDNSDILYITKYSYTRENIDSSLFGASCKDTVYTLKVMQQIKNTIMKYNLSPLEKYMFVYDFVRSRIYKKGTIKDDYMKSRDIARILQEDEIVCAGFANLMASILNMLGIESDVMLLSSLTKKGFGHARVVSHVKDDKYSVNNILVSDPTFECKKDQEDLTYLDHYIYCGRSMSLFGSAYANQYVPKTHQYFDARKIKEVFAKNDPQCLSFYVSRIKQIYKVLGRENECPYSYEYPVFSCDKDDLESNVKRAYSFLNQPLKYETFIRCLYQVRKIEHVIDPITYPFSLGKMEEIIDGSCLQSREDKLLYLIFGGKSLSELLNEDSISSGGVEEDIGRVQVLSSLKQISNSLSSINDKNTITVAEAQKCLIKK